MRVTVTVPAKINLYLRVGDIRLDGFHTLDTVFGAVSLIDTLTAEHSDDLHLEIEGFGATELHIDERNLAVRAAVSLASHADRAPHVQLRLHKVIPIAGGMAGGSADAAAALLACDALWGLKTPPEELQRIAASLGSDVPFCLTGGFARGQETGTLLTPIKSSDRSWWVIACVEEGLSVGQVYAEWDRLNRGRPHNTAEWDVDVAEIAAALEAGNVQRLGAMVHNDLQPAILSLRPELGDLLAMGDKAGAIASLVTGSGPTCVFLMHDQPAANVLKESLTKHKLCQRAIVTHMPETPHITVA